MLGFGFCCLSVQTIFKKEKKFTLKYRLNSNNKYHCKKKKKAMQPNYNTLTIGYFACAKIPAFVSRKFINIYFVMVVVNHSTTKLMFK